MNKQNSARLLGVVMMKSKLSFSLAISGLMLTACVSRYAQPDASVNSAEVNLIMNSLNRLGMSVVESTYYHAYTTETCEPKEGEGFLAAAVTYGESISKKVHVTANKRLYIYSRHKTSANIGSGKRVVETCINLASIIPESSHSYEISQIVSEESFKRTCRIAIKDSESGQVPSSFQQHKVTGRCSKNDPERNSNSGTQRPFGLAPVSMFTSGNSLTTVLSVRPSHRTD